MNFSKPQRRALDLLELNEFKRTSEGWSTADGSFVALITMKSLRRLGLAVRSADRLTCHITEKGKAARS